MDFAPQAHMDFLPIGLVLSVEAIFETYRRVDIVGLAARPSLLCRCDWR